MAGKKGRSGRGKSPAAQAAVQVSRIASGISRSGPGAELAKDHRKVLDLWERDRIAGITLKEAKAQDAILDAKERAGELMPTSTVEALVLGLATGIRSELGSVRPHLEMLGLEPDVLAKVLAVWDKTESGLRARIAAVAAALGQKP